MLLSTVGILPQRFLFGKSFFTKCSKKLNNFITVSFFVVLGLLLFEFMQYVCYCNTNISLKQPLREDRIAYEDINEKNKH